MALLNCVSSDGRLRGTKQYCGAARTGRWAGRLFQPDNLPSRGLMPEDQIELGIEALKDAIKARLWAGEIRAEMLQVMINSRHQEALKRAREALRRAADALRAELTLELPAMELRIAAGAVGEIVGKTSTEDLLDSIFSQFCIGK